MFTPCEATEGTRVWGHSKLFLTLKLYSSDGQGLISFPCPSLFSKARGPSISWCLENSDGGPRKTKTNIKHLLASLSGALCSGRRKLFCQSSSISLPIWQVEIKHRRVSSEKMKVDSNSSLDKYSPPLNVGLLLSVFWPPTSKLLHIHPRTHTPTHTHPCMHTSLPSLIHTYTLAYTYLCLHSHTHMPQHTPAHTCTLASLHSHLHTFTHTLVLTHFLTHTLTFTHALCTHHRLSNPVMSN